jgi:transposase
MKDAEFFEQALGLRWPWYVKQVSLDVEARKVEVEIGCRKAAWADPVSGQRLHVHGWEERKWRHLDTMQFETVLVARVPRVKGEEGGTESVSVPWAERYARHTIMFESWAVSVLRSCSSLTAGCRLLRLSWAAAHRIMDRAVKRGLERRELDDIRRLGIDEKSFRRGQDYVSVLTDIDKGCVQEVVQGRDQASAINLLESIPEELREGIEAVAMDMSGPFASAVKRVLPGADIVYDRYHVSALLNKAVDEVRRKENRELLGEGDPILKGTRYQWLFNPVNLDDARLESFADLARRNLRTARAWLHKENFEGFWSMPSVWDGDSYLNSWYRSAIRSRLAPIKKAARTLKSHTQGLTNYFKHHISNAVTEGLNSKIQALKSAARGFLNFDHYRTRILFFCGKLDLSPCSL